MRDNDYYREVKTKFETTLHERIASPTIKIYGSRQHLKEMHELSLRSLSPFNNGIFLRVTKYAGFYYDIMIDS